MSPVGPFFAEGFKPVSLLATVDDVRSWPGGASVALLVEAACSPSLT